MTLKECQKGFAISGSKGFTLIEVVLVLAIGGLIFLLAFLAFSQASKNRRDTQRRSDTRRIIAELENYRTDNSQKYPQYTSGDTRFSGLYSDFETTNLKGFNDPSSKSLYVRKLYGASAISELLNPGDYIYLPTWKCGSDTTTPVYLMTPSIVTIIMRLEKGYICVDNG